jgi:phospholipid/cholesterol/gamma-HCH transport system substrate-binding protein
MRPTSTLELKVGLLIVLGIVAIVALVLMTDRIRFDRFYTVKAYVGDAAGLRPNSPVTVDGIRVGDVVSLNAVTNPRGNIQVVMRVNERSNIPSDAKLTISSSGIFGDSFLAFSGSIDPKAKPLPHDGTAEVQASRGFLDKASQQAENILAGVSDLLDQELRKDVKRFMRNAAEMAENGAQLTKHLDDQTSYIRKSLVSIKKLSEGVRETVQALETRVDTTLGKVDVLLGTANTQVTKIGDQAGAVLHNFEQVGTNANDAIVRIAPEVNATLVATRQLAERIDRIAAALENGDGIAGQLLVNKALAEDLNHTAIDLSRTAALVADHPEVLVFGMSKEESAAQQERREREKQRRAFHESYHKGIPLTIDPAAEKPKP